MVCFRRVTARQKDIQEGKKGLEGCFLGKEDAPELWFSYKEGFCARGESLKTAVVFVEVNDAAVNLFVL